MKKNFFVIIILMVISFIPVSKVEAKTVQDMYNELANLKAKQAEADKNRKLTEEETKNLNAEIASIANSIEATRSDIAKANDDIDSSKKQIAEKTEETKELLRFLQTSSGENVYLEYLFDSDDYTDFIYRFSVISQLSEYNNSLMNELESLVKELEEKKVTLAKKEVELNDKRNSLSAKVNTLRGRASEYKELGTSLADDIVDLQREINYYEKTLGCSRSQDINTCTSMPYANGFKYPLAWGCVTDEYGGWSDGHFGIDLDCVGEGVKVYAAAPGVVAKIIDHYWCGGNMVYIYHTVNGRPYTTAYFHLLSYNVKIGQTVTDTTVIGYTGGSSTSSSNGGYDSCTTGAHLHFGMAEGHNANNFNTYSFNPRNIFTAFPVLIYSGGKYFSR